MLCDFFYKKERNFRSGKKNSETILIMFRSRCLAQRLVRHGLIKSLPKTNLRPLMAASQINPSNLIWHTDTKFYSAEVANESISGDAESHEFQAETRKLLDIVARSLYSEKEVFIRELISNSSDAIEKVRYLLATNEKNIEDSQRNLEIRIDLDKIKRTMTISDTGRKIPIHKHRRCLSYKVKLLNY